MRELAFEPTGIRPGPREDDTRWAMYGKLEGEDVCIVVSKETFVRMFLADGKSGETNVVANELARALGF